MDGPATSHRRTHIASAGVCTFALLVGVTAVAAFISAHRRSVVLAPRIAPDRWLLSFQPPARWTPEPIEMDGGKETLQFVEPDAPRRPRRLYVGQFRNRGLDPPTKIASELRLGWARHWDLLDRLRGLRDSPRVEPASFGPLDGVRLEDDTNGLIIAVGNHDRLTFCLALLNAPSPLSRRDVELVKAVTGSFEFVR